MSLKLVKYLKELRDNANKVENTDINGKLDTSFKEKYFRKVTSMLIAIVIITLNGGKFSDSFVSYVSQVLSILVGLFITSLIFGLDKFYQKLPNQENVSYKEKTFDTQSYNYVLQFSYITGYNIVRCIFTLVLLSLGTLFDSLLGKDSSIYTYSFNYSLIQNYTNYLIYPLELIMLLCHRLLVLYWISCIVISTLYIVSSMVTFMLIKIKK